ncbi:hypothetical protein BaRGS_00010472 [Batillaria attramentaria]|uniref:Secreted protein n=1 Tax=Batillaria attramentaria TaxID=370345 RepID=A0ABD0LFG3_9CAEN
MLRLATLAAQVLYVLALALGSRLDCLARFSSSSRSWCPSILSSAAARGRLRSVQFWTPGGFSACTCRGLTTARRRVASAGWVPSCPAKMARHFKTSGAAT